MCQMDRRDWQHPGIHFASKIKSKRSLGGVYTEDTVHTRGQYNIDPTGVTKDNNNKRL